MKISDFLLTKCVWGMGMLRVVFNIEAGNYDSKSTFILTLIETRETCVRIWLFYTFRSIYVFLHN